MKKQILAVVLSSMMILGVTVVSSRNAYAHTFSDDESAAFLLLVESIKVELGLVQSNLDSDAELAEEHAEHAHLALDGHTIEEIEERNERLGRDLPAALEDLHDSLASSTEQEVQTKIQNINDLLEETVTVRVESEQMTNSTVQALVIANMLRAISFGGHGHYEIASGIGEEHTHEEEHEEHDEEENDEHEGDEHSSSGDEHEEMPSSNESGSHNMTEAPVEIIDMAHYQTAHAFAVRAQELWTELKTEAPPTAAQEIIEIDSAFPDLIQAINDKASNDDVAVIIHGRIHPNMITAFGLQLATEEEHEGEEHGSEGHAKVPEKLMMYVEETGEHIHEEHLDEGAITTAPYSADMEYTMTATGEAISMEDDEMTEDTEISLDLATWKSTRKMVSMDIIEGSITIGDETMDVHSGQLYYVDVGLVYAFAVVTHEDEVHILKLKGRVPTTDATLPSSDSSQPLDVDFLSPRSKLGSEWSLTLSGQVTLS